MEIKNLQSILKAVSNTNIEEVKIENTKKKIHIIRDLEAEKKKNAPQPVGPQLGEIKIIENPPDFLKAGQVTTNENDICSKKVGYFKRGRKGSNNEFVKLRSQVKTGQVIAIIESMHIENEVIADKDGKIIEFLVENDQPVEYGQPLIRLESKKSS